MSKCEFHYILKGAAEAIIERLIFSDIIHDLTDRYVFAIRLRNPKKVIS